MLNKKAYTFSLCFLFLIVYYNPVSAQEVVDITQQYDCSQTGRCRENELEQKAALYFDNLVPGVEQKQNWVLENSSNNECRVYLRLKHLEDEHKLSNELTISAIGVRSRKDKVREKVIIKPMKFRTLLKKQSIYLGNLPANSAGEIRWTLLLDEEVENDYQGATEKFNTLLYSYCPLK